MNQNRSTRTWLAMVALGLAVIAGDLGSSTRIAAAESATPAARRSAVDQAIARGTLRTTIAATDPEQGGVVSPGGVGL